KNLCFASVGSGPDRAPDSEKPHWRHTQETGYCSETSHLGPGWQPAGHAASENTYREYAGSQPECRGSQLQTPESKGVKSPFLQGCPRSKSESGFQAAEADRLPAQ